MNNFYDTCDLHSTLQYLDEIPNGLSDHIGFHGVRSDLEQIMASRRSYIRRGKFCWKRKECEERMNVVSYFSEQTPANRTNWQTVGDAQPCEAITDFA
ncbi:hypothetical protein V1478_001911 [Vespula squamosa]|uniref:Uncharacterized protein n=1 Tax=Vespula squamosa TaxID=30214 RepID=A0ABD2BYH4_VESSQ